MEIELKESREIKYDETVLAKRLYVKKRPLSESVAEKEPFKKPDI